MDRRTFIQKSGIAGLLSFFGIKSEAEKPPLLSPSNPSPLKEKWEKERAENNARHEAELAELRRRPIACHCGVNQNGMPVGICCEHRPFFKGRFCRTVPAEGLGYCGWCGHDELCHATQKFLDNCSDA